ncbi:MAG TPA: MMPL family transporter [Streptosporangiaceae bacterium]|nr:MMPL family transporter [Streptosporangiaceae bacterium]
MAALTRFVLRHKALVALFWLVVAVAGAMTVSGTTHRMTNSFAMPGQAFKIDNQIARTYGNGGTQPPYVPVITVPPGQRISQPTVAAATGRVFAAVAAGLPHSRLADYTTTHDPAFITRDGRSTFALVYTPPVSGFNVANPGPEIQRVLATAAPAGWHTGVTGAQLLSYGKPAAASKGTGLMAEAMIGSFGALLILAFVYASFLAFLPLLVGGVSVLATFLLVGGLTEVTSVSQIVEFLIALIGLGVAIDYSLLVVSRWREERAAGRDNATAVVQAMHHAGRAVVFSGLTVAIGLLSMIVLPVPMLRSVGYGGVLVPLVSVLVAVTLLPVILASVGPRLDWPRLRTERSASRVFSAWARGVYRHRWAAAAAGLVAVAALMLPALSLHLGEPGSTSQASAGPAHDALVTLTNGGVPSGVITPVEVLTTAPAGSVAARAGQLPGVYAAFAPGTPDYSRAGTAIVTVLPATESTVPAGQATVSRLEQHLLGTSDVIGVGGAGASLIDFDHAVYGDFPLMLALIGLATFLLLTRAFRSVLLAAKAVVFNLVSLAAAYGVLTWVWQDGHGSNALWGIPATGAITMWVPLMVFAFLFGLSMDYEVFILTRIRECYDASGDARAAVTEGLGRTGRLVTSAAAILMLSFLSMSTGPQTDLKILATGLGAGILIDAVVIRCLLVPAMVALFGQANWWLPGRLARMLRVPAGPARASAPASPVPAGPAAARPEGLTASASVLTSR